MRTLHLTQDEFEVLYDVVEETIFQIRDGIEDTDLESVSYTHLTLPTTPYV